MEISTSKQGGCRRVGTEQLEVSSQGVYRENKQLVKNTYRNLMVGMPQKYSRDVLGRVPAHTGRFDLISVQFHIDWTECPRDKRDICRAQMGHIHGIVAIQVCKVSAKFLHVCCLFSSQVKLLAHD